MSILEVKNVLFDFLITYGTVQESDFGKLKLNVEEKIRKPIILKTLDLMEKEGILVKIVDDPVHYVVVAPLTMLNQTLEIPGDLASYIVNVINEYNKRLDNKIIADKTRVTVADLYDGFSIIENLLKTSDALKIIGN